MQGRQGVWANAKKSAPKRKRPEPRAVSPPSEPEQQDGEEPFFVAPPGSLSLAQGGETSMVIREMDRVSPEPIAKAAFADRVTAVSVEHNLRDAADGGVSEMAKFLTRQPFNTLATQVGRQGFPLGPSRTVTVHREWEERFLHEPIGSERHCRNWLSRSCFAGLLESNGVKDPTFGLCEFYTEPELTEIQNAGWVWPTGARLCILCLRAEIHSRFMAARCNSQRVLSNVAYSPIANIVGEEGEYCVESCFVSDPDRYEGVMEPVVIPTVHDYTVYRTNGIRYLKQLLPKPECVKSNFFF